MDDDVQAMKNYKKNTRLGKNPCMHSWLKPSPSPFHAESLGTRLWCSTWPFICWYTSHAASKGSIMWDYPFLFSTHDFLMSRPLTHSSFAEWQWLYSVDQVIIIDFCRELKGFVGGRLQGNVLQNLPIIYPPIPPILFFKVMLHYVHILYYIINDVSIL